MFWLLLLSKSIPSSPSTLAKRKDLQSNMTREVKLKFNGEEIIADLCWPYSDGTFLEDFGTKIESQSSLHNVLGNDSHDVIELENEIIGGISSEIRDSIVHLFRSYSNLMIILREEYLQKRGSTSETCRRSIKAIGEWFFTIITSEIHQLPENFSLEKSIKPVSIEDWSDIIRDSLIQPSTQFLRVHDDATVFIHGGNFQLELTTKRYLEKIISDTIELALQTKLALPNEDPISSNLGGVNHNTNRISALLSGVCCLKLFMTLYDVDRGANTG